MQAFYLVRIHCQYSNNMEVCFWAFWEVLIFAVKFGMVVKHVRAKNIVKSFMLGLSFYSFVQRLNVRVHILVSDVNKTDI